MVEAIRTFPLKYVLLTVMSAAILGTLGYAFGFLGFVYGIMMPNAFTRFDVLAVGVIAGLAAFFSPCAFPVLPGYMSYYLSSEQMKHSLRKALKLGGIAALGLTVVNMGVGLIIGSLGEAAFQPDPRLDPLPLLGVRVAAGVGIAIFGLMKILDYSLNIPFVSSGAGRMMSSRESPTRGLFLYGMGYNVAGVGCTGPILLGLVLYAFTIGSYYATMAAFLAFSLTMAILMVLVTVLAGLSKNAVIKSLGRVTPTISKVGGIVMFAVGIFIVTFTGNEFFTRSFFPFLPARTPFIQEILWVTLVPASAIAIAAYLVLRRRKLQGS